MVCVGETLGMATGRGERQMQVLRGLSITHDKVGMATDEARSRYKGQIDPPVILSTNGIYFLEYCM